MKAQTKKTVHSNSQIAAAPANAIGRGSIPPDAENMGKREAAPIQTVSGPDRRSIIAAKQARAWGINE
jgi:hypothetical protein